MFTLPRGVGVTVDVPLASAAWESPQAVERLAYRGGASMFVGAIPAFENWPLLDALYKQGLISKEDYDAKKAEILKDL